MRKLNKIALKGLIIGLCTIASVETGCGGKYEFQVTPITIDVVHHVSTSEFMAIFSAQCRRELGPSATYEAVNACAADKMAQFMIDLAHAVGGGT